MVVLVGGGGGERGGEGETYPHRERGPETRRDLGEGRPVSCVLCVILIEVLLRECGCMWRHEE